MLVKEEDAKKMFCPLISAAQSYIVCKGSHCMAWRWISSASAGQAPEKVAKHIGYCGLAGVVSIPPVEPDA